MALVAVPPSVVTWIFPVVAPEGTFVVIFVAVSVSILAVVPLKVTELAVERFVPLIVTFVPTAPLVGVKLVMVGFG